MVRNSGRGNEKKKYGFVGNGGARIRFLNRMKEVNQMPGAKSSWHELLETFSRASQVAWGEKNGKGGPRRWLRERQRMRA